MKIRGIFIGIIVMVGTLSAYVDTSGGLFEQLATTKRNGFDLVIEGKESFQSRVIKQSYGSLVVIQIFALQSMQSLLLKKPYFSLAEKMKQSAKKPLICFEMDLFGCNNENYDIVMGYMSTKNIRSIELPVFLFFKDGTLCDVIANQKNPLHVVQTVIVKHCA